MRSIIIGVLLIAPPTFAQQSSTGAAQPQTLSIVTVIERELISGSEPRRETLLACSGDTRTTLLQLNQDQTERLYDSAEINYYVVAGEGAVRMAGRDTGVAAGSLIALPRGTAHGMLHRGKRPLILLVTLSGTPCEQAR
jgi:mannose-6-phosphate isomerase-like protein (cupin superfamily)